MDFEVVAGVNSQFMHDPREMHLQDVNKILQYLKGSPGKGILFKRGGDMALEVYTNADYVGSSIVRKLSSGYCTFLGENLVTWRCEKQNLVAKPSAESKFRSMAMGVCEFLWLKIILDDLKIRWERPIDYIVTINQQ